MNIVRAFLYQSILCVWHVVLVWETADIKKMSGDDDFILIGQVDYDTEKHEIIKYD